MADAEVVSVVAVGPGRARVKRAPNILCELSSFTLLLASVAEAFISISVEYQTFDNLQTSPVCCYRERCSIPRNMLYPTGEEVLIRWLELGE
jgi:hypothetical protein